MPDDNRIVDRSDATAIRKEMTIRATPVVVWRAITEPREVEKWLALRAEGEAAPGNRFVQTIPPGGEHATRGEYVAVEPPRRLRTVVEITLEDAGGGDTRLTLVNSGFTPDMATLLRMFQWGWERPLRALRWMLEEGFDHRRYAYLGLRGGLQGLGWLVSDVLPGSPAAAAGVQPGDMFIEAGGHHFWGSAWPAEVLHRLKPGQPARLGLLRNWNLVEVTLTPAETVLGFGEGEAI